MPSSVHRWLGRGSLSSARPPCSRSGWRRVTFCRTDRERPRWSLLGRIESEVVIHHGSPAKRRSGTMSLEDHLLTESHNPHSESIDTLSPLEIVRLMNSEDMK